MGAGDGGSGNTGSKKKSAASHTSHDIFVLKLALYLDGEVRKEGQNSKSTTGGDEKSANFDESPCLKVLKLLPESSFRLFMDLHRCCIADRLIWVCRSSAIAAETPSSEEQAPDFSTELARKFAQTERKLLTAIEKIGGNDRFSRRMLKEFDSEFMSSNSSSGGGGGQQQQSKSSMIQQSTPAPKGLLGKITKGLNMLKAVGLFDSHSRNAKANNYLSGKTAENSNPKVLHQRTWSGDRPLRGLLPMGLENLDVNRLPLFKPVKDILTDFENSYVFHSAGKNRRIRWLLGVGNMEVEHVRNLDYRRGALKNMKQNVKDIIKESNFKDVTSITCTPLEGLTLLAFNHKRAWNEWELATLLAKPMNQANLPSQASTSGSQSSGTQTLLPRNSATTTTNTTERSAIARAVKNLIDTKKILKRGVGGRLEVVGDVVPDILKDGANVSPTSARLGSGLSVSDVDFREHQGNIMSPNMGFSDTVDAPTNDMSPTTLNRTALNITSLCSSQEILDAAIMKILKRTHVVAKSQSDIGITALARAAEVSNLIGSNLAEVKYAVDRLAFRGFLRKTETEDADVMVRYLA